MCITNIFHIISCGLLAEPAFIPPMEICTFATVLTSIPDIVGDHSHGSRCGRSQTALGP